MQVLEIEVNRCLKPKGAIGLPQIHAFSDGGDDAYGACVFIRWNTTDGVCVQLVSAKAFVSPLKRKTTPKLELMGSITMCRLTYEILCALDFEVELTKFRLSRRSDMLSNTYNFKTARNCSTIDLCGA